ncbi:MAG: hypothetical protein LBT46_04815 [Planctomycetaceae bacterium]|jgi:hypothetical protein|nr:hypothetical protein [Planctomycetaceae bacterium]
MTTLLLLFVFFLCLSAAQGADSAADDLPPIVFTVRFQYVRDHHNTANFFPSAQNEYNTGKFTPGGALKLRHTDGAVETLLETKTGVVRDPDVHWDAKKIVFSYRKDINDSYHIYEMNPDDRSIRQLTFAKDVDDIYPFYLADDSIGFSSTREPKYCGCNRHIMANLYRMDADGANIYQISKNTLFDSRGRMLPDGRILYDRWEYVDRNFGDSQSLWTCNPDGTNHAVYYGNNTPSPGAVIDARPIPGSGMITCVFATCHDRPWGALAIIDRKLGIDGDKPVHRIYPQDSRTLIRDTSPSFNPDLFDAVKQKISSPITLDTERVLYTMQIKPNSEKTGLYLGAVDVSGTLLYEDAEYGCYEPVPVILRQRPPVLPMKRDFTSTTGFFYVQDVYQGTHLQGIQRGDVKYLRVVESPEKRFWSTAGGLSTVNPMVNWDELMTKRVIGVVPVNADGSAYMEIPSEKFVYFQLLDKDGVMLQSMRSGTSVQPGETAACIGCHEDRLAAVNVSGRILAAVNRQPVKLSDTTPAYSYIANVQPVWNQYCVSCHNGEKKSPLVLTGEAGLVFNRSYSELWAKHWIKTVGSGPAKHLQAKSWGTIASKIYPYLTTNHEGINLKEQAPDAFKKVAEWIDLNGPFYPDYATSYPENPYGRCPLTYGEVQQLEKLTGQKIFEFSHVRGYNIPAYWDEREQLNPRDAVYLKAFTSLNFDEPQKSVVLQEIKNKPSTSTDVYNAALQIVQLGGNRIEYNGANDIGGFRYCGMDVWREAKYQLRRSRELEVRKAVAEGRKLYDK